MSATEFSPYNCDCVKNTNVNFLPKKINPKLDFALIVNIFLNYLVKSISDRATESFLEGIQGRGLGAVDWR